MKINWISINDKLPLHGSIVTIKMKDNGVSRATYLDDNNDLNWKRYGNPNQYHIGVTHWTPYLPEHNAIGYDDLQPE